MPSANEIRSQFIDFFVKKHGHRYVPSSPVVPHDDATLMFANAGMNQFKPIFLGLEKRDYSRAVNTQKCIRAGGKHNDLDDVGKDTYHHTFFEMLGNWSFGDYFKKEAIAMAWELLTEVWKLDPSRLHVTVFEGDPQNNIPRDDEAANYWRAVGVPDDHIHLGNKKDNFWEMGSTGPCGPCTEIHYDGTPDKSGAKLVNASSDQVIEIWNNVFIQFNRNEDQSLTPLPAQHVDTGMGFERITKILQGKTSNYDTDIFTPLMDAIREVTGARPYGGKLDDRIDTAYRVIADHIRTLTFAFTDGAIPSNDGRGSVIRSILRRADVFGWLDFGMRKPFLHQLVAAVVTNFSGAFPELTRNPEKVRSLIFEEETSFIRTIERGLKLFEEACERAKSNNGIISGRDAFDLHTEQGFFIDITEKLANDSGLKVDRVEFNKLFTKFKEISGQGRKKIVVSAIKGNLPKTDDSPKYEPGVLEAKVVGWVKDNAVITTGELKAGDHVALLLDRTNFYGEQGGQVGDTGMIRTASGGDFEVEDSQRLGDAILHVGTLTQGRIAIGESVSLIQSTMRRIDVMRNHTATHLLNLGLRKVLGGDVDQKGSLVDDGKTRFDFSHNSQLSATEIKEIEEIVIDRIMRDMPVTAITMPLAEAKKIGGVRAVFGEKYPDPVRVVMIGPETPEKATQDDSIEFCGGTHLPRTGIIGSFKIVSQEAVSKGVRRITAVTGRKAFEKLQQTSAILDDLTSRFSCKPEELAGRVDALQDELKKLQKQLQKGAAGDLNSAGDHLLEQAKEIKGSKLIVGEVPAGTIEAMRSQVDRLRQKSGSSVILLGWKNEDGTAGFVVGVSEDLNKKGIKSNDIMKPVAELAGGKGGGPPHLASGAGKDGSKLADALAKGRELGEQLLSR